MRGLWITGFIVAVVMAVLPVDAAHLPPMRASYSADVTAFSSDGVSRSTVSHDQGRELRVFKVGKKREETALVLPAQQKVYLLHPELGVALDLKVGEMAAGLDIRRILEAPAAVVGHEDVAGLATTKYRVKESAEDGTFEGFVWATDDGIFVKADGTGSLNGQSDHVGFELANIRIGPQPQQQFVLPADLKVVPVDPRALSALGTMGMLR